MAIPGMTIQCHSHLPGTLVAAADATMRIRQSPMRLMFCAVCFDMKGLRSDALVQAASHQSFCLVALRVMFQDDRTE
jgi:hypothetical protein